MNPNEEVENKADELRQNTQIAQYTAVESVRLQNNQLKKLSAIKKNKGGPVTGKMSLTTFFLMLVVAVFFDATSLIVNFIPFIGGLLQTVTITPIAIITFFLWMKMNGISFTKGSRGIFTIAVAAIGFIPLLNALPEWTMYITGIYMSQSKISTSVLKPLSKVRGK